MKKRGFTLAEVLITLGIIGVVAAMTIPTLINSYQKKQYVIGLKKFYTQFDQALLEISSDSGCAGDLKCSGLFASGDVTTISDEIVKYFRVAKNCKMGSGCFPATTYWNYDRTGNGKVYDGDSYRYKFITDDGVAVAINYYGDCTNNLSSGKTGDLTQACGDVLVDVNGAKNPNSYGRDVFLFFIANGHGAKLYPFGGSDANSDPWGDGYSYLAADGSYRACYDQNRYGISCTGRVMEEGWSMNY